MEQQNVKVRIQKILAQAGYGSRRKCEELIIAGKVTVNNRIAKLGESADPEKDIVTVSGVAVRTEKKVYIALYKPSGYATTTMDRFAGRNVMQLVQVNVRIFPVGRLDKDAEGLLLLTNDGEFANRIMHPRYEVEKVYVSKLDKKVEEKDMELLRRGVMLDDGKTWPAQARYFEGNKRVVELIIHEGRHKIVKRMFKALGYYVQRLTRTRIGSITLRGLKPRMWRELMGEEVAKVMSLPEHRRSARPQREERRAFSHRIPGAERQHDRVQRRFSGGFARDRPAFRSEERGRSFRPAREKPRAFERDGGAQRYRERTPARSFSPREQQPPHEQPRRFSTSRFSPRRESRPFQRQEQRRPYNDDRQRTEQRQPPREERTHGFSRDAKPLQRPPWFRRQKRKKVRRLVTHTRPRAHRG